MERAKMTRIGEVEGRVDRVDVNMIFQYKVGSSIGLSL